MRIALFCDTYPPVINGVSRTLGRLVDHARERGHEVLVVAPSPGKELRGEDATAAMIGTPDELVWIPGPAFPLYPELAMPRPLLRRDYRRVASFRPEVVHVATESVIGLFGRRWALRRGIPLVTSFHTMFPDYLPGYRLGFLRKPSWRYLRWFHSKALVSFCPSHYTLDQLRGHGFHDRFRIWSRGVDATHFRPDRRSEALRQELAPGAEMIVSYVGRLAYEKRLSVLLDAFRIVRERVEVPTSLILVGDGPARKELQRTAPPDTHFAGYRTGDPLADAYAAGDVFLFPSDTETFGNVVTEAQASGLPVVAATAGGQTDVVRHDITGKLVPPGDAEAFAEATIELLRTPGLRDRLGRAARAAAERRSWPVILDVVLDAWDEALAGRPLAPVHAAAPDPRPGPTELDPHPTFARKGVES